MAWLILTSLALAPPADATPVRVENAPYHRLVFANADYAVLENVIPPDGDSGFHLHPRDLFYVIVGPAKASTQRPGQALRRTPPFVAGSVGMNVMTAEPFIHRVVNHDRKPFHIVAVEIRRASPSGRAIMERPSGYVTVHDHPLLRAWRLVLEPGQSAPPLRPGGEGVRIFVRGGMLAVSSDQHPDQRLTVAAGDFEQLKPRSAVGLKNVGTTPIELVDVELK